VNLILELVGGHYLTEDLNCIATKGRIILVGLLAGTHCDLDLGKLLQKRVRLKGTTLRARPLEEKIVLAQILGKNIVPLIENKLLKPVIDRIFDFKEAAEAHEFLSQNESFGKVVLNLN
jgi:NADPH:quinone reductase-like Zn-dependent oxidoreductase